MYQSKAVQNFKFFSSKELKMFLHQLRSHQKAGPELILLTEKLLGFYPDFTDESLERHRLFGIIYGPEEPYNEKSLPYLFSDLVKMQERFLVSQLALENDAIYNQLILQAYFERKAEKFFRQEWEKQQKKMTASSHREISYFLYQYQLNEMANQLELNRSGHSDRQLLTQALEMLDLFYFQAKLKSANILLNFKDIHNHPYNPKLLPEILEITSIPPYSELPPLTAHRMAYELLKQGGDDKIQQELLQYIQEKEKEIPFEQLREIYGYLRNHIILRINRGMPEYFPTLFTLYKTLLQKDILLNDGFISPWDYKNIINIAIHQKDMDFASDFIHQYREKLEPGLRQSTYYLNLANLHFVKKEYEKTLQLLQKVDTADDNFYLAAKHLMLQTYYEMGEFIPLFYLFDSFYVYLKRNNNLSKSLTLSYINFIHYLKKIAKLKLGSGSSAADLKNTILEKKQTISILWLTAKLDEIIDKQKRPS